MDSTMTINIRVVGRQAMQQLSQVQSQVGKLGSAVGTAGKAGQQLGGFFDMLNGSKLIRAGKNLQWVGRQLTFSFTLPLVAAGIALFKTNMNIERSMREVIKVYGDGTKSAEVYKGETDALRKSFELLSTRFGEHQEDVIDIAAAWASAGAAGVALAEGTKATLETMVLGSIDAEEATKGLIAIQATWGLSTKKNADGTTNLGNALATLNEIENQTGIRMEGLIEVLERAGGAGRVAGTDIRHLSAMAAALVPAAGTATQAGNALKSIISSLVNPTKKVTEALGLLGIKASDPAWLGKGVTDKIETIAQKFKGLSSANQGLISSVLAGKFQFNRFSVLMNDIASGTGYYAKALAASSDQVKSNKQFQKELNDVLTSNPRKWDIITNAIRNTLADAFTPMLPLIFQALQLVQKLTTWFGNLSEESRGWFLLAAAVLAVVGPVAQLVASFTELFGLMKVSVKFFAQIITKQLAPLIGGFASFISKVVTTLFGTLFTMGTETVAATTAQATAAAASTTAAAAAAATATAATSTAATGYVLTNVRVMAAATETAVATMGAEAGAAMLALPAAAAASTAATVDIIEAFAIEAGVASAEAGVAIETGITLPAWAIPAAIALVVVAVIAVLVIFRKQIWNFIKQIGQGFAALPGIIANVFTSIINVISRAMTVVIDWLSYLNPFARHSPSLVDNVRAGVATILDEYAKFNKIPGLISGALNALDQFNAVSAPGRRSLHAAELSDIQGKISAKDPAAGKAAGDVINQIGNLESILPELTREIAAQGQVVALWTQKLKAAGAVLEDAKNQLQASQDLLQSYSDQLDEAKAKLQDFANAPITGMKEYGDQLFENEQQQRELQLQLLQFEKQGISIDKIKDRYAALNGEIEMLRGKQTELRLAGAGSDVLGVFDDSISAIKAQQGQLNGTEQQITDINKQLDELDLNHRFLELTRDITFEPLLKQIDEMVNGTKEMSFDDIVAGIKDQQRIIGEIQPKYDDILKSVKDQEAVVKAAQADYDAVNAALDVEQQKLDDLNAAFTDINGLISDMESGIKDFAQALAAAGDAAGTTALTDLFNAGADANFSDFGDTNVLKPEGDVFDIEAFNKQLDDELQKALEGMDFKFDPFERLKDIFNKFVGWIKDHWAIVLAAAVGLAIGLAFGPIGLLVAAAIEALIFVFIKYKDKIFGWVKKYIAEPVWNALKWLGEEIQKIWDQYIYPAISWLVEHVGGVLVVVFDALKTAVTVAWDAIGIAFSTAWSIIEPILKALGDAIMWVWDNVLSPFFSWIYDTIIKRLIPVFQLWEAINEIVIVGIGRIIEWVWKNVIEPVLSWIWDFVQNALPKAWQFLQGVVQGVWDAMGTIITVAWAIINPILAAIVWFVTNVLAPIFTWLWHEIIEPVWSGIGSAITWAWDNVIKPVLQTIIDFVTNVFGPIWDTIKTVIKGAWEGILFIIGWVWDKIASVIESGVNFLISAFNLIARTVNSIADFLSIDVHVGEIEKISLPRLDYNMAIPDAPTNTKHGAFAQGGTVGEMGGRVAGARALVGEGSNVWPEYIIPTDPKYRGRAANLFNDLGKRINAFAAGGVIGLEDDPGGSGVGGGAGGGSSGSSGQSWWERIAGSVMKVIRKGALETIWNPAKMAAQGIVSAIPVPFVKNIGQGLINTIDGWVSKGEDYFAGRKPDPLGGAQISKGAGSWKAVTALLNGPYGQGLPAWKILRTFTAGARTRTTGNVSWHALDRAIDIGLPDFHAGVPTPKAKAEQLLQIASLIKTQLGPNLHELIYGNAFDKWKMYGYSNIFNGSNHAFSQALLDEHSNHVHASLAKGGRMYVPRTLGGLLMRVGEGRSGEQVQVLPTKDSGGGSEYHFYGDLSFPNVRSGDDAESFLKNLESLTTKANGRN